MKQSCPEIIFIAKAFTRPKIVYNLAMLGFSQPATYFIWRNTKAELTEYFAEIIQAEVRQDFRPNLWPNTPEILSEYLQVGGRPTLMGHGGEDFVELDPSTVPAYIFRLRRRLRREQDFDYLM